MAFIYIMTNPAYEGYVKIGFTDADVYKRAKELSSASGVMFDFEVYGYYETPAKLGDKSLHKIIDGLNPELRVNKRREFYKMSAKAAYEFLYSVAELSGTEDKMTLVDEDDEEVPAKTKRRPPFSFKAAHIPFGSEITFNGDNPVTAIVKDDRHITYNGETTSVSDLAQKLLDSKWQVQGTLYFTYEGETLSERRRRMEAEGTYE